MKNAERSYRTKARLAAALKETMERKPLSKITVSEIIDKCNVNRKTFYYHFSDIYDLLKWMFENDAIEIVKQFDLIVDAEEAMMFVIDYINNNKHIVNCAYDSIGRDEMKRFFYLDLIGITEKVIDESERKLNVKTEDDFKAFLADFYTEAIAGMIINYIKEKEKYDKNRIVEYAMIICTQSLPNILKAKGTPIEEK